LNRLQRSVSLYPAARLDPAMNVPCVAVERDRGELDPFASLEISARNLRRMLGR
jgi:hypothetical protein